MMMSLHNLTNGAVLARRAVVADGLIERLIGLLSRSHLAEGEALIIPRCRTIHTWFMRFPIDVVFIRGETVMKVVPALEPWRVSGCWDADTVIELPKGTVASTQTCLGHRLSMSNVKT